MKQFLLLVIFCLTALGTQAQLAVIQDPDGYVNVRSKPDISGEVIMKLTTADIFYCFEEEGQNDWYPIDVYQNGAQHSSGYIHRSRVKFIHDYESISVSQALKDKIVFKNKTIQVDVKTKPFDPKSNTIEYDTEHKYVENINHKKAWGIDGNIPRNAYEYMTVTMNGNKIILPAEAYKQLFEPTLEYMNVYYDVQHDILYIEGLNSDGAGGYTFAIIIKNKKFERTIAMIPF
ncbi:SH3 domain-containing protein [Cytophaga aurantiaca]|uniref:SH3 domain-containing protein n=1 Tax=Cytophaga aurantiaca TaxID=29530 RepID=UPI00036CC4DC|nr:SH3 domain-containing protein [Cytophaga aurantiaca]